ncbi:MAG: site-specific integrase, partial [Hyphomicrobiaceae bacterium]|nr:site-specific integrase [Hyphomicrobiaceae bacterium]
MATLKRTCDEGEGPLEDDTHRAAEGWLGYLAHERGAADNTLGAYERDLRQLLAWLRGELRYAPRVDDLLALDARRLRAFMASRRRAGLSSRSLARTLSALRAFFRWLETEGIGRNRALLQVAMPRVPHGIPKPLSVEKATAATCLLEDAGREWTVARDCAVLLLLYGSGLRISEALGLSRRDAPLEGRDVLRITGKGAKERL